MSHQLIKMYQQVIDEDTDYQMENHSTANMNKSLQHDEIANSFNVLFGYFIFFYLHDSTKYQLVQTLLRFNVFVTNNNRWMRK